jgi:hypothetical protein
MIAVEKQAIADADPWYRDFIRWAYAAWNCLNLYLFDGALMVPFIVVDSFRQNWLGACLPYYGGKECRSMILIDSVYISDCWLRDKFSAGRLILLHEMVHQLMAEVKGQNVGRDNCHSDAFAKLCNQVSLKIGSPVRVKSHRTWRRGHRGIDAATWPFCLYPEVPREMRRIQTENQRKPVPRPALDPAKVATAARAVEQHLIGSAVSDQYNTVLTALGIVPEREALGRVIGRNV